MDEFYKQKLKKLEELKENNLISLKDYEIAKNKIVDQFINNDNQEKYNSTNFEYEHNQNNYNNLRNNNNKKIFSILILILIIYSLFVVGFYYINVTSISSTYNEKIYNPSINELNNINNYINLVPNFYQKTEDIKIEIDQVIDIYNNLKIDDAYESRFDFTDVSPLILTNVRNAYLNAVQFNLSSKVFDLSYIVEDPSPLILGREFRTENGVYYFEWIYTDNQWKLNTNLPNDKVSGTLYNYSYYNSTFSYREIDNSQNNFQAYTISIIDDDTIDIYCHSNDWRYILNTDD